MNLRIRLIVAKNIKWNKFINYFLKSITTRVSLKSLNFIWKYSSSNYFINLSLRTLRFPKVWVKKTSNLEFLCLQCIPFWTQINRNSIYLGFYIIISFDSLVIYREISNLIIEWKTKYKIIRLLLNWSQHSGQVKDST